MTEAPTGRVRFVCEMVVQTARLMVGVPDYQTYVAHRTSLHPDKPMMNYEEFFRERQTARYATAVLNAIESRFELTRRRRNRGAVVASW
jgi:uncharacterized short protein YbdD (DUF466 family)